MYISLQMISTSSAKNSSHHAKSDPRPVYSYTVPLLSDPAVPSAFDQCIIYRPVPLPAPLSPFCTRSIIRKTGHDRQPCGSRPWWRADDDDDAYGRVDERVWCAPVDARSRQVFCWVASPLCVWWRVVQRRCPSVAVHGPRLPLVRTCRCVASVATLQSGLFMSEPPPDPAHRFFCASSLDSREQTAASSRGQVPSPQSH